MALSKKTHDALLRELLRSSLSTQETSNEGFLHAIVILTIIGLIALLVFIQASL